MGSEAPPVPGRKRTKDWLPTPSPPHTHSPGLPESCCGLAEGRERGRDQGKKGGGRRGLWRKDRRSKTREVRRKKAPAAPANRFAAMPALPSALRVAEQNATSVGCQAYTEGLWGTGRARRPGCWGPLGPPCPVGRGPVSPQPSISPPSFKSSF